MNAAPNQPKLALFESKLVESFQNTLKLIRGIFMLTKKIFML